MRTRGAFGFSKGHNDRPFIKIHLDQAAREEKKRFSEFTENGTRPRISEQTDAVFPLEGFLIDILAVGHRNRKCAVSDNIVAG